MFNLKNAANYVLSTFLPDMFSKESYDNTSLIRDSYVSGHLPIVSDKKILMEYGHGILPQNIPTLGNIIVTKYSCKHSFPLQKEIIRVNALSRFHQPIISNFTNVVCGKLHSLPCGTKKKENFEDHLISPVNQTTDASTNNESVEDNNVDDTDDNNTEDSDFEAMDITLLDSLEQSSQYSSVDIMDTFTNEVTQNLVDDNAPNIRFRDGNNIVFICGIPAEEWWMQNISSAIDSKMENLTRKILYGLNIQQQQIQRMTDQLQEQRQTEKRFRENYFQQHQQSANSQLEQHCNHYNRYHQYQTYQTQYYAQQQPAQNSQQQQQRQLQQPHNLNNYNINHAVAFPQNQQQRPVYRQEQPIRQPIQRLPQRANKRPIQQHIPQHPLQQNIQHPPPQYHPQQPRRNVKINNIDRQQLNDIFEPFNTCNPLEAGKINHLQESNRRERINNNQQTEVNNNRLQEIVRRLQEHQNNRDNSSASQLEENIIESQTNTAITVNLREAMSLSFIPLNSLPVNNVIPSNAITLSQLEKRLLLKKLPSKTFEKLEKQFAARIYCHAREKGVKFHYNIDYRTRICPGTTVLGDGLNGLVTDGYFQNGSVYRNIALKTTNLGFSMIEHNTLLSEGALYETVVTIASEHPNVIKSEIAFLKDDKLVLALELMHGSLRNLLSNAQSLGLNFSVGQVVYVARRILNALVYIAETWGIIHNDIKCANILISKDGQIKLSDFGLARQFGVDSDNMAGTPGWMAPEVADYTKSSNESSDIWSFGMLLIEMIDFDIPFDFTGLNERQLYYAVSSIRVSPSFRRRNFSPLLRSMLSDQILCIDPSKRLTARELLKVFDEKIALGLLECCTSKEMEDFIQLVDSKLMILGINK